MRTECMFSIAYNGGKSKGFRQIDRNFPQAVDKSDKVW